MLSPYDTSAVWQQVKKHFNIETRYDLLDHCYAKFDKAFFASLCVNLSELAEKGDALASHLFEEAGRYLAKATTALLPHVHDGLLRNNTLNIVCVGSVWKSWNLLKAGYSKEISGYKCPFGLNLITLTQTMAVGAVYIAVDSHNLDFPRDYSHNYEIFHHIPPSDNKNGKANTNGTSNGKKCVINGSNSKNNGATNGKTKYGNSVKGKQAMNSSNGAANEILVQDG